MRKPAALLLLCALYGCAHRKPRRQGEGRRVLPAAQDSARDSTSAGRLSRSRAGSSGLSPLDMPPGNAPASAASSTAGSASGAAMAAQQHKADGNKSALPPESNGQELSVVGRKSVAGSLTNGAPGEGAAPAAAGASSPSPASAPKTLHAAGETAATEEAAPPPMAELNKEAINKLLENRLDIGAYRVQIAPTDDFSDANVLFDKTYDVMENINLFEEFRSAGVNINRSAYWVRIAFIDLLAMELPWTKPRLYGLNKQRLDAP